jgi:predicted Zn-dependent peptidase
MHTKILTLDNGLKVIAWPTSQLQTFGIALAVNHGSIDEDPKVNGASHYLEHMLFKGTKKRTWKDIAEEARTRGMYQNGYTDRESTTYVLYAYKGYFTDAVDLLSDMVKNSTMPKKEFELERGTIINENLRANDSPQYILHEHMPKALYAKHPARMSVVGDDATIKRTRLSDVLKIYDNYYAPKNMVVSVCGAISAEKVFSTIKEYFNDFDKEHHTPKRYVAKEKQERRIITISKKGIKQTRLGIGFKCNGVKAASMEEYLAMRATSVILNSRIFDEIREKRGLSYDPYASYSPYCTFGFIATAAGVEPKDIDEAKEIMLKEFEKLQNGEIKRDELEKRKKAISISSMMNREQTLNIAQSMTYSEMLWGDATVTEKMPKLIKTVTLDDVRKYCSMFINVDKYSMVTVKPAKS